MKLRYLLLLNGLVLVLFALGMLLMPGTMLDLFRFSNGTSQKLLAQLIGVELLASGLVSLFANNAEEYGLHQIFTLSFFIADVIGFIVVIGGTLSGTVNALGWIIVAAYLLLALGFGYFQFIGPVE